MMPHLQKTFASPISEYATGHILMQCKIDITRQRASAAHYTVLREREKKSTTHRYDATSERQG